MAQTQGEAYWQEQLESWRQSGLTQTAYCKERGLSIKTFTRWRTKERKALLTTEPSLTLVPLRVSGPIHSNVIQLHSPSGWRIELNGTPLTDLAAVLRQIP